MTSNATTRRRLLAVAASGAAGVLAGCTGDEGEGASLEGHLADANGYDGELVDATGEEDVTVEVGAGNGFSFDPAGVTVEAGTTVVWEWTGAGGPHNVDAVDGSDFDFSSGDAEASDELTFEQTFDATGVALYECTPHANQGMLGAVEVVE